MRVDAVAASGAARGEEEEGGGRRCERDEDGSRVTTWERGGWGRGKAATLDIGEGRSMRVGRGARVRTGEAGGFFCSMAYGG